MTAFNIHNELKYHWIWKISAIDIFENISIKVISPVPLILLSKPCQCCLFFIINLSFLIAEQAKLPLPRIRTQTSLSMKMYAPGAHWWAPDAQRKAGRRQRWSVSFPWSLAVHHQSLAFRARLYDEKNEAPEEEAEVAFFIYKSVLSVVSVN